MKRPFTLIAEQVEHSFVPGAGFQVAAVEPLVEEQTCLLAEKQIRLDPEALQLHLDPRRNLAPPEAPLARQPLQRPQR